MDAFSGFTFLGNGKCIRSAKTFALEFGTIASASEALEMLS